MSYSATKRWSLKIGLLWWALACASCVALLEAPRLPWLVSQSDGDKFAVNGFNTVTSLSGPDSLGMEIQALGLSLPDTSSQDAAQTDGSSDGTIIIPALSNIP